MADQNVETFHQDGRWFNRVDGEKGATGPFHSKAEAVAAGREHARHHKSSHVVRGEDGEVGETDDFSEQDDRRDTVG